MLLYIIRHAAAEPSDEQTDDCQRPLTEQGRQRFAHLVSWLARRDFAPRLIVTSPLVRCVQTAALVAQGLAEPPPVVERPELEPGSDLPGLLEWMEQHHRKLEQAAWVGHAPDVGRMAAELIGDGQAAVDFAKGAVAALSFEGRLQSGSGVLRWLITPKLLEK